MICNSCGHDYPSTVTRCTGCGQLTPRRMRSVSNSRLIEFPKQPKRDAERDAAQPAVPSWRAEVSERVRAVRAKRNAEAEVASDAGQTAAGREPHRREVATSISGSLPRSDNPLVEAALSRVRRAADNGFSSRTVSGGRSQAFAGSAVSSDRDATARVLEPEPEFVAAKETKPLPRRSIPSKRIDAEQVDTAGPAMKRTRPFTETTHTDAGETMNTLVRAKSPIGVSAAAPSESHVLLSEPIDEIEPRDYLADEIRRVDRALNDTKRRSDAASMPVQLVAAFVDLLVIGFASAPFLALIELNNGSYSSRSTETAAAVIVLLLAFFYLALTHCLRGRTFGMMFTGTQVLAKGSNQPPSVSQSFRRAIGYFVAVAPAGLGFLWALFDRNGRGWHDLIAGTVVVKDS